MRAKSLLTMICCFVACLLFVSQVAASPEGLDCPPHCKCTDVAGKHGMTKHQVDCTKQGLLDIPDGIPTNTEILKLSNNKIDQVTPGKLSYLTKLEELYLMDNRLTTIGPGSLEGLASLSKLYLTRNKLTDFPDVCNDVGTTLTHLGIDENTLTDKPVPPTYANCSALLSLILAKNTFTKLTNATLSALKSPAKLQSLKMNSVKLTSVEPGALMPLTDSLMSLDLSDNPELHANQLAAAFQATTFSTKFVGLTLKNTGWTELPVDLLPRGHFPQLDILHLNGGKIASIAAGALDGVTTLTKLYFDQCPIAQLDKELSGLTKLTDLSLKGSGLSLWTAETFGPLSKLKRLDLSGAKVVFVGGLDGKSNPLPDLAGLDNDGLRLGDNQLVCNCSLLWLTQQLKNLNLRKKFFKFNDLVCKDPSGAKKNLTEFTPTDCNSTTTTTITTTTISTTTSKTTATTASAVPTSTTAPVIITTTGQHGGGGPTTAASGPFPVWGMAVIASSGVVVVFLAVLALILGLRLRRRRASGDDSSSLLDRLVGDDSHGSGGGGGGGGGGGCGCLELLSRGRRSSQVPVPEADYTC